MISFLIILTHKLWFIIYVYSTYATRTRRHGTLNGRCYFAISHSSIYISMLAVGDFVRLYITFFFRLTTTSLQPNQINHDWGYSTINNTHFATLDDIPNTKSIRINCQNLLHMTPDMYQNARRIEHYNISVATEERKLQNLIQNCTNFLEERKFVRQPVSEEELQFPIAYTIMAYKDAFQVERLLRAIYRPQNLYCIHLDRRYKIIYKTLKVWNYIYYHIISRWVGKHVQVEINGKMVFWDRYAIANRYIIQFIYNMKFL